MTAEASSTTPAPPPYAPVATGQVGETRSVGLSILLAVVTVGIYCVYWTYKTHAEIKGRSGQGVGGLAGALLYLVFNPITFFLVPNELSTMLEGDGRTSPVTWKTGFWLFLPLAGMVVWFVKVQGALNDYWRSLGAS